MNQTNVIITSGSKNQIIHVPMVTLSGRSSTSVTPIEIVTSSSGTVTINRSNQMVNVNQNNNNNNGITNYSPVKSRLFQSPPSAPPSPASRYMVNNRQIFDTNDADNSDVKALYEDKEMNQSHEQLLLPPEPYIKQEILDEDEEEYEEYESLDDKEVEGLTGIANSKTQYKCSGCGKGFCYTGWLDRHKLTNPACRNAQAVPESYVIPELNNSDRQRPSLEGRLQQLLCCPNEGCNFVSHWVQSLNKHVYSSCKFSKNASNSTGSRDGNGATSPAKKGVQTCHICNNKFANSEQHVQHMKNVHQIKLYYQCSECKLNFDNKYESDAHLEEHTRMGIYSAREKLVSTPIRMTDTKPVNGSQQCWQCELCNKSYLSLRAYEIHRTSCEKQSMQSSSTRRSRPSTASSSSQSSPQRPPPQRSPTASATTTTKTMVGSGQQSIKHFNREQIEAIHGNDFRCRYCRKKFDNSFGLCNHLSRRPTCRELYYKIIPQELKKTNSLHLMKQVRRQRFRPPTGNPVGRPAIRHLSPLKTLKQQQHATLSPGDRIVYSRKQRQGSLNTRPGFANSLPPFTNSARCDRCRKVFVGKNPCVALTNHLRGSTCVPVKFNSFQKPQIIRSRTFNKKVVQTNNNTNRTIPSPQSRSNNDNRFYCKLCPRVELKNRVSLGCHLTIYHGLPQVNVTTAKGDGYRCQNCSQVFESKYFYNLHRQDCDLTSAYVGMVNNENVNQIQASQQVSKVESGIMCNMCGKSGFPTQSQMNIHQKYQCAKRLNTNRMAVTIKKNFAQVVTAKEEALKRSLESTSAANTELARLNDRAKNEPKLTMCDECGRGPYNSYYYFMEHKKKYCNALSGSGDAMPNKAKKSFPDMGGQAGVESFCLNPTVPRARKTMNYTNVSSPAQTSQDSSAAAVLAMDTNADNESEEVVISVSEVTKCSVCSDEFDDVLQFIRHRLSHITQDLIQNMSIDALECELCGARVHHYQRIQQHLILHLQNVQILKKKNLIEVTKKSLLMTIDTDQSDDDDMNDGDDSVLHCPYCKSEHTSRAELANHIRTTCPYRYQCSNCNKTYMTKESYNEHRDECTKNTAINRIASKAPKFKCRNCNLEFRIKQQLLWHEHACNKVYTADHSGRVEEVIERTLSCSVCGLVSDVYESKVRHESQCLKRYLNVIGNNTEEIKTNGEQLPKPLSVILENIDPTTLSDSSGASSEVPEGLIKNLKDEFGIRKDVKVVLNPFDEEIVRRLKTDLYCERDESIQFETLKESFMTLVRRLIKNDEVLRQMSNESSAEVLLDRMLKYLGEQVIDYNGLNALNCFRQNLQKFLKLTIKDDTLVLAYRDAESVDEAIINMLNFECELHC